MISEVREMFTPYLDLILTFITLPSVQVPRSDPSIFPRSVTPTFSKRTRARSLVSPKRVAGAGVGVGMLRGGEILLARKKTKFQRLSSSN